MSKITQADFKYLKNKIYSDKDYHEKEFLQRINPDLIDAYFEGDPDKDYEGQIAKVSRLTQNRIFPTTTTLLPTLVPQNPKFIAYARKDNESPADDLGAKVAASALNYYFEEMGALHENQLAVMSAWLYGIGITKQGWRTVFKKNEAVKVDNSSQEGGLIKKVTRFFSGASSPSMEEEENPDYIAEEGPFLYFVNPKDVYFDKDEPFGKGKFFTHHLKRCLYEIRMSGLYTLDEDFYARFKRGKDEREIELDLYEQWSWQKDGLYVFVFCEGYDKPLRYDKFPSYSEGFPFKTLALNVQANRVYPVSNMKVAQRQQRLIDYILTLQKEMIEKFKDITVFDGNAFDPDTKEKIIKNEIGTNVFTQGNKPPLGAAVTVQNNPIPKDLFNVQALLDQNINEILAVVGARQGDVEADTATQERIQDFGNTLRASGLEDKVREFFKAQGKKLFQDIKQFDTAEHLIKVTGLSLQDPMTGQLVTEKWVEFGTINSPQTLRDVIPADLDIDIDVTEMARRDLPVVRKQMMEYIQAVIMPLLPLLQAEGKKFNAYRFAVKMGESFETLGNVEQFFDDLQPPVMPGMVPSGAEGMVPPPVVPQGNLEPELIEQGLQQGIQPQI